MSEPTDPPDQPAGRPLRSALIVAAVLVVLAGGVWFLLTSFEAEPPNHSELVDAYESSGMPPALAECAADAILDNLSDHEVSMIVERGPSGAPVDDPDVDDEPIDRARAALTECRDLVPTTTEPGQGTDDQPTAPQTSTTAEGPQTTDGASFDTVAPTSAPEATTTTTVAG
ncbi:MAG: hypothetical protein ABI239_03715 [Aquihabitans sp.]